jgi:hypothetical protein
MAMGRASVAVAGFALLGGASADPAGSVHIDPTPDRFGRVLFVCVEPVDLSARGAELAAAAMRALRETFAVTPGSPADALIAAFVAANAAVMAENRPQATGRWDRRICVGATAIALAGRDVVVAQAAPSQAILVQDGQVYPFPDVASWRGDFQPDAPLVESHPLGFGEDMLPRLYESQAAPGDLIVLCSTSVGRALARDEDAVVALYGGELLTADLEGSIDRLERLLAAHDIGDAFAVAASIARLPRKAAWRTPVSRRRRPVSEPEPPAQTPARPTHAPATNPGPRAVESGDPFDAATQRPPRFETVRDWAADVAELLSNGRQRPTVYPSRERALAAPGALSVHRYRESSGLPAEWRANLPRGPGMQIPARLLAVSLLLFVALGGTGYATVRQREQEARAASALMAADAAIRGAQENSGAAMTAVAEAERAVAAARVAGAGTDVLAPREHELARVRDDAWSIRRLGDVVRLGALPPEAGGTARLALAGQTLFLAADSLYEVDADAGTLVALLSRGDRVGDADIGAIRHVSIDDGHVVASDGTAMFRRDATGRWERASLAVDDIGGLRSDAPLIAWGDAAYGLSWQGDIVRFDESAGGPSAAVWAAASDTPDLELTRDLAIDGRIHVLLEDGRTLTFSRGALVGTLTPFIAPALSGPSFLAAAPFANAFYIVDHNGSIGQNTGRIVRVDAAGDAVQYLTPEPVATDPASLAAATALAAADDLVVDEMRGMVYWVAGGELWSASLSLP